MDPGVNIPAGKLFMLTSGEYSDFHVMGTYLALVDINLTLFKRISGQMMAKYLIDPPERFGDVLDLSDPLQLRIAFNDEFLPTLVRAGAVVDIDVTSLHYGSYSRFELFDPSDLQDTP